jgi:hypothetical protein
MSLGTIWVVLLFLVLAGVVPTWPRAGREPR